MGARTRRIAREKVPGFNVEARSGVSHQARAMSYEPPALIVVRLHSAFPILHLPGAGRDPPRQRASGRVPLYPVSRAARLVTGDTELVPGNTREVG